MPDDESKPRAARTIRCEAEIRRLAERLVDLPEEDYLSLLDTLSPELANELNIRVLEIAVRDHLATIPGLPEHN